jgi:putative chitinase
MVVFFQEGRGYIQLTGRNNYTNLSKELGIDFVAQPKLLETPKYASLSAGCLGYQII